MCTWRCCSLVSSNSLYLIRLAGSGPRASCPENSSRCAVHVHAYIAVYTATFFHCTYVVSFHFHRPLIGSHHTYVHVPMMQRNTGRPVWPVCEYVFCVRWNAMMTTHIPSSAFRRHIRVFVLCMYSLRSKYVAVSHTAAQHVLLFVYIWATAK